MRLLVIVLTLTVVGCATRPVSVYEASPVSQSRVLAQQWLTSTRNTGSLIIKRDSGFMGAACTIRVFIDGMPAADLAPSEKVEFFLPLGEHILGASPNGICGGGTSEASVVIASERQKIFRIGSGQSSDIQLQPSAF